MMRKLSLLSFLAVFSLSSVGCLIVDGADYKEHTGNIIAREEIEISWEDTGKSIYEKSREAMIELVKKTLDDILENKIDQIKQTPDMGTYHNSKEIDSASKIDLDKNYTARQLFNIIRARMFSPYPTAYFFDDGKKYSVEIKTKELKNENES